MDEFRTDLSSSPVADWPEVVLGLWLRTLWLGVALGATGVIMLFAGEPERTVAVALLVIGAGLARLSWVRARALLGALGEPAPQADAVRARGRGIPAPAR